MNATHVDLKAFTEDFDFRKTGAETDCGLEITTLRVLGQDERAAEFGRLLIPMRVAP